MGTVPGSSTVEHSAVNRRVASSNLARGANFSFSLSQLTEPDFQVLLLKRQVSCKCHVKSLNRALISIHSLICFLHRFTNLLDHAELIPALCLGAGVAHGPLNYSVWCDPAQARTESMPQVVNRKMRHARPP